MPKNKDINSILIIGSGPIVIGQACEFDYSGSQAAKALKQEGYRVILVNSNPATIMTDPEMADATYIEPLTVNYLKKIIEIEQPDAVLPTLGGQTALNLSMELENDNVFDKNEILLLGASAKSIEIAENRWLFKSAMESAGIKTLQAEYVKSIEEGVAASEDIGFPLMLRPSFILGGGGTSLVESKEDLEKKLKDAFKASPTQEVLIEESVYGWKEYELEVMRDSDGNGVIVCGIENFDPMGVHTGDSITVAPIQTLSDKEYQIMRDEALLCLDTIGIATGGSNVQFAVNPKNEAKEELISALNFSNRTLGFVNAPAIAQRLVEKSINSVADLAIYKSKRDLMFNKLTSFGYEIVKATGGFYLFPKSPINDVDFCNTLKQEKILVVPGSGFGAPNYFLVKFKISCFSTIRFFKSFL